MVILYIISILGDLYFAGSQIFHGGAGDLIANLLTIGLPLFLGLTYLFLIFKPKNKFGNIAVIINFITILFSAILMFLGGKAGEGGFGLLILILLGLLVAAIAS